MRLSVENMDIVTIGNRRYRKIPIDTKKYSSYEEDPIDEEFYSKSIRQTQCVYNDESCYLDQRKCANKWKIQEADGNGIYKLEVQIPSAYFGYIIGRNGETKRHLEADTKTIIQIPSKKASNDVIIIKGPLKSNLVSCINRIDLIVSSARQRQSFTHIITFPLNFEILKQTLEKFKSEVLKKCGKDRGVDESIFQNPHKLHLTICTLVLLDEAEKKEAVQILDRLNNSFAKELVDDSPIKIRLKGLEYMIDDPGAVDVLY
jgi:activating signal cointegrator complex subunit 1